MLAVEATGIEVAYAIPTPRRTPRNAANQSLGIISLIALVFWIWLSLHFRTANLSITGHAPSTF